MHITGEIGIELLALESETYDGDEVARFMLQDDLVSQPLVLRVSI